MKHPTANPKWTLPEGTELAKVTREAVFSRIEDNASKLGDARWSEVVSDRWQELFSAEDGEQVADEVFDRFQKEEGRKFYAGCEIAVIEKAEHVHLPFGGGDDSLSGRFPRWGCGRRRQRISG